MNRSPIRLEIAEISAAVVGIVRELREVLVARIWVWFSLEEVARLCGISPATAGAIKPHWKCACAKNYSM